MNLFFLHVDPQTCAQQHCDKHVVKMLLETAQILYTAHHLSKSILPKGAYKLSYPGHPTVVWASKCYENYKYASLVGIYLSKEYTHRYGKIHSCDKHIKWLYENIPSFSNEINYKNKVVLSYNDDFQSAGMTPVPLAMPEDVKSYDTIHSYRSYYIIYKKHFTKWTSREVPYWFTFYSIRSFFKKQSVLPSPDSD